MALDAATLALVTAELNSRLLDARIDKIFEPTRDEVFQDLYQRLNDMLNLCGFSALDPRVPFDLLILYCICVPDMFDVDARMRAMFKTMFGERMEQESE